jgi:hypothetical protein
MVTFLTKKQGPKVVLKKGSKNWSKLMKKWCYKMIKWGFDFNDDKMLCYDVMMLWCNDVMISYDVMILDVMISYDVMMLDVMISYNVMML